MALFRGAYLAFSGGVLNCNLGQKIRALSVINQVWADCGEATVSLSGQEARDNGLTSYTCDSEKKHVGFLAGCCRLQVRALLLCVVWPFSICIFILSLLREICL